jgi:glutamate formiminotransferase
MNNADPILECIPNFSEGVDEDTIAAIANGIRSVDGQYLLHVDQSPSANRTVMTFAGNPASVIEAAFQAIKVATAHIDMTKQQGAHPRIGATDVCPLVPLANMSMDEAAHWADLLAQRITMELGVPVYLYEQNARHDYRRALPDIRKGQYEGIIAKMQQPAWVPDYGSITANNESSIRRSGATIIGARKILVAFNISLDTKDEHIAANIAKRLRSSGYYTTNDEGTRTKVAGLLPQLRAIGWYMSDFETAQVSMNLIDYHVTSPLTVWHACSKLAAEYNVQLIGCEVVGLIPLTCVVEAGRYARNTSIESEEEYVKAGIEYLKLDAVKPFDPKQKILEYALAQQAGIHIQLPPNP